MSQNMPHTTIAGLDMAAMAAILGSLIGWLPPIAALLGIVWYCVLLYDRFFSRRPDPPTT